MLQVKNLSFAYKKHTVFENISFDINKGEIVCLLGQNGAGKTTLFKCIMGFLKYDTGAIFLDETPIKELSIRQIAKKIAYIPQAHDATYNYPVLDIVLMGTTPLIGTYSTPSKKEEILAQKALDFFKIGHLAQRGYSQLSGGEQQLVLVARALAQQTNLLVMDEPTANLDYGNQQNVMAHAKALAHNGYAVLISTHNPEHVLYFADKVLVLQKNGPLLYGTPSDIITPKLMKQIYGVTCNVLPVDTSWGEIPVIVPKVNS